MYVGLPLLAARKKMNSTNIIQKEDDVKFENDAALVLSDESEGYLGSWGV